MKVRLLFTPGTPADRDVEYLQRRLEDQRIPLEVVDADSREGSELAEVYDLLGRPAVIVTDDAGAVIQQWQGQLPTAEEISAYYGTP